MTSPLLIGTTFHDPSTQSQTILFETTVDVELTFAKRRPEVPVSPLSIVNFDPGVIVPIPIFHPVL